MSYEIVSLSWIAGYQSVDWIFVEEHNLQDSVIFYLLNPNNNSVSIGKPKPPAHSPTGIRAFDVEIKQGNLRGPALSYR